MTARHLRAVVADDEPLARRVIRDLLAVEGDVSVVGEARTGLDAVETILATAPDLLFLDIDMPDLDGFAVLESIAAPNRPHTIFVTAYDAFAVRAFEEEALDYLVKPFTDDRFRKTLTRARDRLTSARNSGSEPAAAGYLERLSVTIGRRTQWIEVGDVRWIEADDYYVRLHTDNGTHLARIPLGTLERRLDPSAFLRVHRGALVSRTSVRCLTRERAGTHALLLTTGARVAVSERRLGAVSDWLGQQVKPSRAYR